MCIRKNRDGTLYGQRRRKYAVRRYLLKILLQPVGDLLLRCVQLGNIKMQEENI